MENVERTLTGALVPNGEAIIAGYGFQGKDDYIGKRRLKFARFIVSGFEDDKVLSINNDVSICGGNPQKLITKLNSLKN